MANGPPLRVADALAITRADERFLVSERVRLLEAIAATGSINQAARALGIGYKAAWRAVDAINNLADEPVVERTTGGRRGGGTRVTAHGRTLIKRFRAVETQYRHVLAMLQRAMADSGDATCDVALFQRLGMKVSARNQLYGTVVRIDHGMVNSEVALDLGGGDRLVASVTRTSVHELGLDIGAGAWALIKASFVMLAPASGQRLSARNQLTGAVVRCIPGAVNAEVTLELAGGRTLTAIITNESLCELGIDTGSMATALFKASHVILGVDA